MTSELVDSIGQIGYPHLMKFRILSFLIQLFCFGLCTPLFAHIPQTEGEITQIRQDLEMNRLESLMFVEGRMPPAAMVAIIQRLEQNTSLKTLDVYQEYSNEVGIAIANALRKNKTLQKLKFFWCSFNPQTVAQIVEALQENTALLDLRISSTSAMPNIAALLEHNSTLQTLELEGFTDLGGQPEAAQWMSLGLKKNRSLTVLDLGMGKISDPGIQKIAEALEVNSSLKTLKFFSDCMSPEGQQALQYFVQTNTTLEEIGLKRWSRPMVQHEAICQHFTSLVSPRARAVRKHLLKVLAAVGGLDPRKEAAFRRLLPRLGERDIEVIRETLLIQARLRQEQNLPFLPHEIWEVIRRSLLRIHPAAS